MKTKICLLIVWCTTVLLVGCASMTNVDSIKIVNVDIIPLQDGEETYKVTVDYNLATKRTGVLAFGYDLDEQNSYNMVSKQQVDKGAGLITLSGTLPAPNKGQRVKVVANLSEYPHPKRWQPLISDRVYVDR